MQNPKNQKFTCNCAQTGHCDHQKENIDSTNFRSIDISSHTNIDNNCNQNSHNADLNRENWRSNNQEMGAGSDNGAFDSCDNVLMELSLN